MRTINSKFEIRNRKQDREVRRYKTQQSSNRTSRDLIEGQTETGNSKLKTGTRTGQAAMEYLMTYGWAILVLLVVFGLLVSTGLFSPSYFVNEECNLGPNFPCRFRLLEDSGKIKVSVEVTNGFSYPIRISRITVSSIDGLQSAKADLNEKVDSGSNIAKELKLAVSGAGSSVKRLRLQLVYISCAPETNPDCKIQGANPHTVSGRLTGKTG